MLKTIVKNGVIADVQDTCTTLQEVKDEVQLSIMDSRDAYIKDVWYVMKYDDSAFNRAKNGAG